MANTAAIAGLDFLMSATYSVRPEGKKVKGKAIACRDANPSGTVRAVMPRHIAGAAQPIDEVVAALAVSQLSDRSLLLLERVPAIERPAMLATVDLLGISEECLAGGDVSLRGIDQRDDDLRLAAAAAAGSEDAWEEIVRRHSPAVHRFVAASRFAAETDDLTQEIFLKVFRGLPTYRGLASFRSWILRIARYHLINHRRDTRARRAHEVSETDLARDNQEAPSSLAETVAHPDASPADRCDIGERRRLALRVFREIAESYRLVLVLTEICGCSYEEAAAVLGVASGTIKSRMSRARAQIVRKMRVYGLD
jgi:RNA polymerase sigma-70 factor (ECF subfamily)